MSCAFKIALAAAFAAIAFAPTALADPGDEVISVRIAYGDLNPSTPHGAHTLLKRIKIAARKVCNNSTTLSPLMPTAETTCRRDIVDATVAQLNIGAVTTAWNMSRPSRVQLASR